MHLKKILKSQNGIGLIEVIAAFSISIVVITSLVSLALYTMRSSLSSKLLLEGTKIATREIERVRALRDSQVTWDTFMTAINSCIGSDKKCSMDINPLTVSTSATTETIDNQVVTRYFYVVKDANDPNNIVRVSVYVSWSIGGQNKGTNIYTDLSNWQPK